VLWAGVAAVLAAVAAALLVPRLTGGSAPPGGGQPSGGQPPAGVDVLARIAGSDVAVTEQLRWPRGQHQLELVAADTAQLAGAASTIHPRVERLSVTVDGRPADVTRSATGWTVTAPPDSQRLHASYRLTGAVRGTSGPAQGRALAALPLLVPRPGPPTLAALVEGAHLLNVVCLMPGTAAPVLCARQQGGGWTASVPADSAGVLLAQLEQPASRSSGG
jgi:hypothetical protein